MEERLELAAEILASVEGPVDEDWDAAWLEECERRTRAAAEREDLLAGATAALVSTCQNGQLQ